MFLSRIMYNIFRIISYKILLHIKCCREPWVAFLTQTRILLPLTGTMGSIKKTLIFKDSIVTYFVTFFGLSIIFGYAIIPIIPIFSA